MTAYTATAERKSSGRWVHTVRDEYGNVVGNRTSNGCYAWAAVVNGRAMRYSSERPRGVGVAAVPVTVVGDAACPVCMGAMRYSMRCADGTTRVVECHSQRHAGSAS